MIENYELANKYVNEQLEKHTIDEDICALEQFAIHHKVPIITKEVREILKFFVKTNSSKNILEIGTAIGYSGIILARLIESKKGILYTIEREPEYFNQARDNFKKFNVENIVQIYGEAKEELLKIEEKFDFIFIDASKSNYKDFFIKSLHLLNENGIVFIDNMLFKDSLYVTKYKYKTIAKNMQEFIDYMYERGDFILLPIGDGVGVYQKR